MAHAGFPNGLGTTAQKIAASLAGDNDENRRCIIELHGTPIGEMNYRTKGENVAEIGIKICDATQQNNGYGTTLLRMFVRELFSRHGFEKIVLDTNANNKRAQHVYEKVGFERVGVRENSWKNQQGQLQLSIDYELIRK
ncbi:MAG: GNAT family N-acetyltransferase [Oscillospiraceae bacterium]|nr:GNAT family N-acetyltransferase [Oscillospiraceae bacterium]